MVTGLLYGDPSQIGAQLIGCVACIATVGTASFLVFKVIQSRVGLRSSIENEIDGLDTTELTMKTYTD